MTECLDGLLQRSQGIAKVGAQRNVSGHHVTFADSPMFQLIRAHEAVPAQDSDAVEGLREGEGDASLFPSPAPELALPTGLRRRRRFLAGAASPSSMDTPSAAPRLAREGLAGV